MTGQELVRLVEQQLLVQNISKADFYSACGITSTAFSNWRKGLNSPSPKNIKFILDYLHVSEADVPALLSQAPKPENESTALRELLRDRSDLRVLLRSASDLPPSAIYKFISEIEKLKEDTQ